MSKPACLCWCPCILHHHPCRLFAVGYAARKLSSTDQLVGLMWNPPLPYGLDVLPETWTACSRQPYSCTGCGELCSWKQVSQSVKFSVKVCGSLAQAQWDLLCLLSKL